MRTTKLFYCSCCVHDRRAPPLRRPFQRPAAVAARRAPQEDVLASPDLVERITAFLNAVDGPLTRLLLRKPVAAIDWSPERVGAGPRVIRGIPASAYPVVEPIRAVDDALLADLAAALRASGQGGALAALSLPISNITGAGLAAVLAAAPCITALNIGQCKGLTSGALLEPLSRTLRVLDVSVAKGTRPVGYAEPHNAEQQAALAQRAAARGLSQGLEHIGRLTALEELRMRDWGLLAEEHVAQLSSLLSLRVLDATGCRAITTSSWRHLSGMTRMTELHLGYSPTCPVAGAVAGEFLGGMHGLCELTGVTFGDVGLQHLRGAPVRSLSLHAVTEACREPLEALAASVRALRMSGTGDEALELLGALRLESLELYLPRMPGATYAGLAHLVRHPALAQLDLVGAMPFSRLAGAPVRALMLRPDQDTTDAALEGVFGLPQLEELRIIFAPALTGAFLWCVHRHTNKNGSMQRQPTPRPLPPPSACAPPPAATGACPSGRPCGAWSFRTCSRWMARVCRRLCAPRSCGACACATAA